MNQIETIPCALSKFMDSNGLVKYCLEIGIEEKKLTYEFGEDAPFLLMFELMNNPLKESNGE